MTITEQRQAAIGISVPYMDASQVLLVKKGAPYKTLADLKGKKVGVQADTTGKDFADQDREGTRLPGDRLPGPDLQANNVKSGRVEAAINDNGALYDFVKDNPDTEVAAEFDTGEKYGFAAEGRPERRQAGREVQHRAGQGQGPTASTRRSTRSGSGLSRRSELPPPTPLRDGTTGAESAAAGSALPPDPVRDPDRRWSPSPRSRPTGARSATSSSGRS